MAKKDNLTEELKKHFGFDTFKGNQRAIIENVLAGNDTFVLMPTGGGKSLCYQLPSLMMQGTAIVISPLIALMKNQVDAMRNFSEEDGVSHFINSSLNKSAIDQVKDDIRNGRTKLLYVAPESLTKDENVEFLRQVNISFYAVALAPNTFWASAALAEELSARPDCRVSPESGVFRFDAEGSLVAPGWGPPAALNPTVPRESRS